MTKSLTTQNRINLNPARTTINRIGSIEEELIDRILVRLANGSHILSVCQKLAKLLSERANGPSPKLCGSLMASINCNEQEARCLIELSLDLLHAQQFGTYRRPDLDLSQLRAIGLGVEATLRSN